MKFMKNKAKWWATGINLIIIMVLVNVAVAVLMPSVRLDLTKNKLHTLSSGTIKTVKELKDVVTIKAFVTTDLPPEVKSLSADLKTILKEFENLNPSNVKISYIDPTNDDKAKEEAMRYGIQPLQFSTVKSDKFEMSNGYFGLVMVYGTKQEVLPVAGDVGNVEYFLVSGIKKLVSDSMPKILLAEEGSDTASGLTIFSQYASKNYQMETVDLAKDASLQGKDGVLTVIGSGSSWGQTARKQFDNWVAAKKPTLMFIDKIKVDNSLSGTLAGEVGYEGTLKNLGVEIESQLVLDSSASIASFRSQSGGFLTRYPFWIEVRPENIDQSLPALSGIQSLMIPWASPLKLSDGARGIVKSSKESWVSDSLSSLSPTTIWKPSGETSEKVLAAIVTDKAKLAVIGDADMINDQFVTNNQQNLIMAFNLIDYLSADESLLSLRAKVIDNPPLLTLSDNAKQIIRWVNVAAPAIMLVVMAITAMIIRRAKNRNE